MSGKRTSFSIDKLYRDHATNQNECGTPLAFAGTSSVFSNPDNYSVSILRKDQSAAIVEALSLTNLTIMNARPASQVANGDPLPAGT